MANICGDVKPHDIYAHGCLDVKLNRRSATNNFFAAFYTVFDKNDAGSHILDNCGFVPTVPSFAVWSV